MIFIRAGVWIDRLAYKNIFFEGQEENNLMPGSNLHLCKEGSGFYILLAGNSPAPQARHVTSCSRFTMLFSPSTSTEKKTYLDRKNPAPILFLTVSYEAWPPANCAAAAISPLVPSSPPLPPSPSMCWRAGLLLHLCFSSSLSRCRGTLTGEQRRRHGGARPPAASRRTQHDARGPSGRNRRGCP